MSDSLVTVDPDDVTAANVPGPGPVPTVAPDRTQPVADVRAPSDGDGVGLQVDPRVDHSVGPRQTSARVYPLAWGRRYLMVRPDHFRVAYAINPYMDLAAQPDHDAALAQWWQLVATLERLGARVDILDQRPDAPDMVYAMNLGLALTHRGRTQVTLSHMRYPQRRMETDTAEAFFQRSGFATGRVVSEGNGPTFEAGDAFPYAGSLVVGFGPRTSVDALATLAATHNISVQGLRLTNPGMYHLDLAFCPLDEQTALVCPSAFDDESADTLLSLVPDPLVLSEAEALTFCANSVVVGRDVVMPDCPDRVAAELRARDFDVHLVDVSEFHKGGGSIRCLTNPLDIVVGRDLAFVPGGEVRIASPGGSVPSQS